MKTVLVHDWLYSISGAEKVLECIYRLFPSKVYTLIKNTKNLKNFSIPHEEIVASFIQKLPFGKTKYPYYFPLFPYAIESFNITEANVILSSSSCIAKNILTHSHQLHICYCHTPMRYLWDLYFDYLKLHHLDKGLRGIFTKWVFHKMRNWDLLHAIRVDHYIANSQHVAKRIEKLYQKKAEVIYPPVDCQYFALSRKTKRDFYVTAARLVPYKKVDVIIQAFSFLTDKQLIVIGGGPELEKLKAIATKNVEFTGYIPKEKLRQYFHEAKAFIYMAYEDFGIFPVEAQAAGLPVIAYGRGGVFETILENRTGIFFKEQTVKSLVEAIQIFEKAEESFDEHSIQRQAQTFSEENFNKKFKDYVNKKYQAFIEGNL
jgi:glycosyltransferase involved in cell wall biosynthesis